MESELLEIQDLSLTIDENEILKKISLSLPKGKILGIVGESGSGKSITSLAIMGLLPKTSKISGESKILFNNGNETVDLLKLKPNEIRNFRGNEISMIFQEPMTSLNPSLKCGEQVEESIRLHLKLDQSKSKQRVIELFEKVMLPTPERIYNSYPHQLSGGQRQRVMIAMAVSCNPKILIADEPTTALDVTVQRAILDLIRHLQQESDMSCLFISHDLGVIAEVCDEVAVMYKGEIVEHGSVNEIFNHPKESYTKGLIACRPRLETRYKELPTIADFIKNDDYKAEIYSAEERKDFQSRIYSQPPILEVRNLSKYFYTKPSIFGKEQISVKAVDDMNFKVYPGETLGLVGESGSGKTTLSRTVLLLEKPTAGEIFYHGKDIVNLSKSEIRKLRKEIQIIFQDPYSSLNPRMTVGEILTAPMKVHSIGKNKSERIERAAELLEKVGLKSSDLKKYPHEFSGGQRQRIGIARALALEPKFIICDESVSALDVSVQAQVLNLLNGLKEEFGLTYIFISHDLAVVKYMSDQLLVMQHGRQMELADADEVYSNPKTNYTKELIDAIPKL
ncbi:MAG: ABC transporter ATP-binding protein [Flavobacteriia bacterium]|nr:ABC transporter ATP-binding protein [Flavobacteriia bacterium]